MSYERVGVGSLIKKKSFESSDWHSCPLADIGVQATGCSEGV